MNFLRKLILLGFLVVTFFVGNNVQANEVGFSVEPLFPKNQLDQKAGYFHLLMEPDTSQEIQVKLKNTIDKEVSLAAWVSSAKTNVNGVIDYSDSKNEIDASLEHDLSKLVEIKDNITLPPKSEKIIDITVKMPGGRFEGIIAGGITFEEKKEGQLEGVSSHTGIKNKFSYVIALLMQQQKEVYVQPELTIGKVAPTQFNSKSSISAEIRNVASVFLNDITVETTITDKKTKKVVFEDKKTNFQMAPNTTMDLPLFLNGEKLEHGEYHYKAFISGKNGSDEFDTMEWELESDFEVDRKIAKELNKTDTQQEDNKTLSWWVYLLIILNALLAVAVVTFLVVKNKKSNKVQKKRKKKKLKKVDVS